MTVTPARDEPSIAARAPRVTVRAVLVAFLVFAPAALAQEYDFKVLPLADATARNGQSFDVTVDARHTCPATGVVRMLAGGDAELEVTTRDATWGDCGSDGYHRATSTLTVRVLPQAKAGVHGLAVGAHWGGHTASTPLRITVPYRASVDIAGPSEGIVLPGRTIDVPLDFTVTANADTWLVIATDAPSGWQVQGTGGVDVRVVNGSATVTRVLRFTTSSDAYGDVPVVVSADPRDALSHREQGAYGAHAWTARLPPKLAPERPPSGGSTAPPGAGDPAAPVPTTPAEPAGDGLPVWVLATGLIALGAAAFWWSRRPSS